MENYFAARLDRERDQGCGHRFGSVAVRFSRALDVCTGQFKIRSFIRTALRQMVMRLWVALSCLLDCFFVVAPLLHAKTANEPKTKPTHILVT